LAQFYYQSGKKKKKLFPTFDHTLVIFRQDFQNVNEMLQITTAKVQDPSLNTRAHKNGRLE